MGILSLKISSGQLFKTQEVKKIKKKEKKKRKKKKKEKEKKKKNIRKEPNWAKVFYVSQIGPKFFLF